MSTNTIFVVAQRGFSAQVEIKIGIRRDEKIRFARTNSSSGNPPLMNYRKLPIISGALTFEISSPMGRLFSGGAYYRVVKKC